MPELAVPDPGYDERLGVPLRWWVQGVMLLATFWLAFVVAIPGAVPWLITGVLGLVLVVALASIGSARVGVAGGSLHAGRASCREGMARPYRRPFVREVTGLSPWSTPSD